MNQLINQLIDSGNVLNLRAARALMNQEQRIEQIMAFIQQETYLKDKYVLAEVVNTEEHF